MIKRLQLVLFLVLFTSIQLHAQNDFGEINVSASVSLNPLRVVHKIPFLNYDKNFDFNVGQQFQADFCMIRVFDLFAFSIGGGFSRHQHRLNIKDYQYELDGAQFTENPTQTINASAILGRGLIHMLRSVDEDELDVYWGGGQQYIKYNTRNTSNDPNFYTEKENLRSYYFVAGARYYFIEGFGIQAEFAVPGTYMFSLGLSYTIPTPCQ